MYFQGESSSFVDPARQFPFGMNSYHPARWQHSTLFFFNYPCHCQMLVQWCTSPKTLKSLIKILRMWYFLRFTDLPQNKWTTFASTIIIIRLFPYLCRESYICSHDMHRVLALLHVKPELLGNLQRQNSSLVDSAKFRGELILWWPGTSPKMILSGYWV